MALMLGEQLKASGMQVYSARASHIVALSFGQMAGTLYTEKEQSLTFGNQVAGSKLGPSKDFSPLNLN